MIQPIDLRIGSYYKSVKFGVPVKCTIDDLEQLSVDCAGVELDNDIISQVFEPILLTEELLERLGFIQDNEVAFRWYLLKGIIAYDLDDNCIRIGDSGEFGKRKYVHDIQNLIFALKGEELNINL